MTPYYSNSLVNLQSFHEVAIAPHDDGSCTEGVDDCPLGRFDHFYEKHINRWNFKFERRPFCVLFAVLPCSFRSASCASLLDQADLSVRQCSPC